MPLTPLSKPIFATPSHDARRGCSAVPAPETLSSAAPALSAGQRAVLFVLRGYKLMLSPLFAGSCRFLPSCSDYARDAIIQHGLVKGAWLAARRLGRCHPFGDSGYDPVPGPGRRG
jgi:putative membrane protein insertion efficiency factor